MEKIALGRTGLQVTVAGLGCGGHARLGLERFGQDHAAELVRKAYDSGVNFFDTAEAYGTQAAVGQGLRGLPRDSYVLSTKFNYVDRERNAVKSDPKALMHSLEESLRLLETDCVDVYHLHGVAPEDYDEAVERFYPELERARRQGKIRFAGITERFGTDTGHEMLVRALPQDLFDVVMVGYNLLNPSAAKRVLPLAAAHDVGVLCMFAVRSSLADPEKLSRDIGRILDAGQADPALLRREEDLSFLCEPGAAGSLPEAAYRYCRHTPGVHVTLFGTGNPAHMEDNLRSLALPALPAQVLARLEGAVWEGGLCQRAVGGVPLARSLFCGVIFSIFSSFCGAPDRQRAGAAWCGGARRRLGAKKRWIGWGSAYPPLCLVVPLTAASPPGRRACSPAR